MGSAGSSASSVTLATQAGSTSITLPSLGGAGVFMVSSPDCCLPERLLVHCRDVGGDYPPARIRKLYPGLALPPDEILVADLEFEVHGGDVAPQRQDFQPNAPFLDAWARRPRHAVGMDLGEAVAVLVHGVADGVRAPPEGGVQHVDVLVDQRLLVTFEQSTDLLDDFREVRLEVLHVAVFSAFSNSSATATRVASLPRGPMMDRPTGRPSTVAPGRLTCGWPANPPWAHRQVARSRNGSSTDSLWPRSGAGNGVVGRHRIVRTGRRYAMRPRASWRIRLAQLRSLSGINAPLTRLLATVKAKRGLR